MPSATSASKTRLNRLFCAVAWLRTERSPRQSNASLPALLAIMLNLPFSRVLGREFLQPLEPSIQENPFSAADNIWRRNLTDERLFGSPLRHAAQIRHS